MTNPDRFFPSLLLALALIWCTPAGVRANGPDSLSPFGLWLTESRKAVIEIHPCAGARLCGRIVWMADNTPRLCRMQILEGFEDDGTGEWHHGTVLDPRDGSRWQAEITPKPGGILHMRGFVLMSLFGETQVWTRAPDGFKERCQPAAP